MKLWFSVRTLRIVAVSLALLGGAPVAQASYIHAKAILAQVLIKSAWNKARARARVEAPSVPGASRATSRPWPWADTTAVGRLTVSRLGVDLIVLSGSSGRTLAFGPGHVAGSARLSSDGNVAVAGHRDTHFRFLKDLRQGDVIRIEAANGSVRDYAVRSLDVVDKARSEWLQDQGDARLTLVTCYPFEAVSSGGPLRYVVTAIEVGASPEWATYLSPTRVSGS